MALTHAYKFLSHFIPSEEFMQQLLQEEQDIQDMIDESLLMDQYGSFKKS
jgi:hypothetical protein